MLVFNLRFEYSLTKAQAECVHKKYFASIGKCDNLFSSKQIAHLLIPIKFALKYWKFAGPFLKGNPVYKIV